MTVLILFRHGKSDWAADYSSDHERPLAERGREAARRMGRWLAQTGRLPDRAVSSSAVRARETLTLAAKAGRWECPIEIEASLYEASPGSVLDFIRRDVGSQTLLLVGHEPTMSSLVAMLIGGGSVRLPTGAMAAVDFGLPWSAVVPGSGQLHWLQIPRMVT